MEQQGQVRNQQGLDTHGIRNANTVWWNLSTPALYEHSIQRHEGLLAHLGPLVVRTGQYTGPADSASSDWYRLKRSIALTAELTESIRVPLLSPGYK